MDKSLLRKHCLELRRQTVKNSSQLVDALCRSIGMWLNDLDVRAVGFYRPFRSEPDITPVLLEWAEKMSERVLAVPVIDDLKTARMHYVVWSPDAAVHGGRYGIEEPLQDEVCEPEVIFSPCVGVTREGYRLGNGGGYFDRYLALRRETGRRPLATVAVAFESIVLEGFEPNAYDIAFDWVATEAGVVRIQKSATP